MPPPVEIERFCRRILCKHDLVLIPNGTNPLLGDQQPCPGDQRHALHLHPSRCTDWMRLIWMAGPRPLNIDPRSRTFTSTATGDAMPAGIICSRDREQWSGLGLIHQPAHKNHFYDVQRYKFSDRVDIDGTAHARS